MERKVSTLSSSDEDEDEDEEVEERQTLITQNPLHININNNNNNNYSPKPHLSSSSSSIFQIDNNNNNNVINNNNSPKLTISKKYLFSIFLFIFILILFLTTSHLSSPSSHSDSIKPVSPISNRILESQLHALYLLRNQQFSLFKLWNHTYLNLTYPDLAFFNSQLLSQISLNKQIQQLLLSAHQTRGSQNNNSGLYDFNYINSTDFELFSNTDVCGKVDQKLTERKTLDWKPDSGKYLFAICVSGQMSNHLICLEKHMFFAALLNRVLVIPSAKVDYQFDRVLDIEHINKCLGRKVVVTFDEFAEAKKSNLHIDRFICYFSKPQACFLDDDHVKKIKSLGLTVGSKLKPAWVEDVKSPSKRTMQDVVSKFGSKDDVIAIGDVFFADVEREMVMQPGGPIAHKCKTLIEPSRLIMLTAQRFVQTFLGERFIALHFRRHGFLKFCNAKSPSCFFPIPQAAECISRLVEKANTPVIYLSTDAAESETNLLQSLIVLNGKTVPLVKRPARNSAEKWDALLYRHGIEGDPQVEAMLDKTISAMSSVFIGASGSTFTEDILRLRKDWGSASLCDEYLCQGEVPNFIADNE